MDSVTALLHSGVRFPTALVGNNDSIAFGAMRALQSVGLIIPDDISITGIDGLPLSILAQPALTTVSVPCAEIGVRAVQLLHEIIRGRCKASCKIQVETELIPRDSTASRNPPRPHPSLLTDNSWKL
jgi:LacI family transcriptional regulator